MEISSKILTGSGIIRFLRSGWAPAAVTVVVFSLFLHKFAATQFQGNITGFSYISKQVPVPPVWTQSTFVRDDAGYDGMYYYYVAHDPLIRTDLYTHFYDNWTAYRYQRIVYPLTVYLFSAGHPPLIPYMMVIVNLAAVGLGVFFVAKIAQFYCQSVWFALLFGFYPGLFLPVTRNLTEPLQLCWIAAALYFYCCKHSRTMTVLLLTLAALTKETALLVPASFGLYEMVKERSVKKPLIFLVPLIVYLAWQWYIFHAIGKWSFATGASGKGEYSLSFIPLLRFTHYLLLKISAVHYNQLTTHEGFDFFLILSCLAGILLSFRAVKNISNPISLPLLVFGLFSLFIADPWVDFYSYSRTLAPLFLFLVCHFLATKDWIALLPVISSLVPFYLFLKCAAVF